jgi:hypothetical protein
VFSTLLTITQVAPLHMESVAHRAMGDVESERLVAATLEIIGSVNFGIYRAEALGKVN